MYNYKESLKVPTYCNHFNDPVILYIFTRLNNYLFDRVITGLLIVTISNKVIVSEGFCLTKPTESCFI